MPPIKAGSLDTPENYLKRGDQYSEIKDFDNAIADYSQAILLKPEKEETNHKSNNKYKYQINVYNNL